MHEFISQPWPWYVAGPLIGLMIPMLLLLGNKKFGVSSSLRHICASIFPAKVSYLAYDWKKEIWNLFFVAGIIIGAFVAVNFIPNPEIILISSATSADLNALGITDQSGMVPAEIFSWTNLLTLPGFVLIVVGGFLVGFGTRYADGCTSGHGIMGLANLQWPSLVAVCAFFAGGLIITHLIYPVLF